MVLKCDPCHSDVSLLIDATRDTFSLSVPWKRSTHSHGPFVFLSLSFHGHSSFALRSDLAPPPSSRSRSRHRWSITIMLDHCPLLADRDGHFGHLCPISSCSWQSPPSPSNADHVTATRSHFTSAHPDLHVCPIQTCDWYTSTADPDEIKDVVRTHLVQIHENLQCMNAISDDTFAMYDLHPCRTCNSPRKIYCTLGHLRRHQNIHTPPARPDNKSNSQLIHDTFQTLPLLPNHWPRSLQWLNTHELEPPPFHESSW